MITIITLIVIALIALVLSIITSVLAIFSGVGIAAVGVVLADVLVCAFIMGCIGKLIKLTGKAKR